MKSLKNNVTKDIKAILINDDLGSTLGKHTIYKEDLKIILDILKPFINPLIKPQN